MLLVLKLFLNYNVFNRFLLLQHPKDIDGDVDVHIRPYWHFCDPCNVHYDIIGNLETMDDDTMNIMDIMEVDEDPLGGDGHLNKNRKGGKRLAKEMFASLSEGLVQRLLEMYKFEFEAFGYDSSVYLRNGI